MPGYPHHFETIVDVPAAPQDLFENIDDHARLAEHDGLIDDDGGLQDAVPL